MQKMIRSISLLLMVLMLPLMAAAQSGDADPGPELDSTKDYYAVLETSMGRIVCQLLPDVAPVTVRNFVNLIEGTKPWKDPKTGELKTNTPFYDGIIFHRVIPGFMIQTGDPLGIGRGGPGYQFEDEFSPKWTFNNSDGILAMANAGPGTNGSQIFITDKGSFPSHLNNRHTIFGITVEGIDVVAEIARVPRGRADKPNTPVSIDKATVVRLPKGTDISNKPWDIELEEGGASAEAAPASQPAAAESKSTSKPAEDEHDGHDHGDHEGHNH